MPGKDGLLHISRVAQGRVDKVEDVLSVGDEVKVKVLDVDEKGKISLDRLDKPATPSGSSGHAPSSDAGQRRPGDGGNSGAKRHPRRRHTN